MLIGAVAIGRNEGDRLRACLVAAKRDCAHVVYVDSNSTDGSVALARSLGVDVVELDLSIPFTAARARNEGFATLRSVASAIDAVQFIDGDCEIVEGWIARAAEKLASSVTLAVVCGRRRERFPGATIYNALCDIEWNSPVGPAKYCGGDALVRVSAFEQIGGYDGSIIAGEEPEMCVRLRAAGYNIFRLDAEMTLHDAAMTRFAQWWKRNVRAGHAFAEGFAMHGSPPESHFSRDVKSNLFWGLYLPLGILLISITTTFLMPRFGWTAFGLLAVFPLQAARIAAKERLRGLSVSLSIAYGLFTIVGKLAQVSGILTYRKNRASGVRSTIIEYKK